MIEVRFDGAKGFELPPFLLFDRKTEVAHPDNVGVEEYALGSLWQDRIGIKWEDEDRYWFFPIDPVISVEGKNTIVRRSVLKQGTQSNRRGTVKELWSMDDYTIDIAGVLKYDNITTFRSDYDRDLLKLRNYMEDRRVLQVQSELLRSLNITAIAVESYTLPFTKGLGESDV